MRFANVATGPRCVAAPRGLAELRAFLLFAFLCGVTAIARAGELPKFASDAAADRWLRETSPYYLMMTTQIEAHASYSFRGSDKISAGMVGWESGKFVIELSNALSGPERVSILIFELTNAFQDAQHHEIDVGANKGRIKTAREFGLLHELVELDGLRHHRAVLQELEPKVHGVPAAMLQWINPELNKLDDYLVPYAYEYIKAQGASGHTAHYYKWFYRQAPGGSIRKKKE